MEPHCNIGKDRSLIILRFEQSLIVYFGLLLMRLNETIRRLLVRTGLGT